MSVQGATLTPNSGAVILEQFEADLVPELLEFGKRISTLDADIAMFLARKSLCLLDVLQQVGAPPPIAEVLSDRFLDCDLGDLDGKRVALIDDTLIVGTSLARARSKLLDAGAEVSTHVFCRNRDFAGDDPILAPDEVWVDLDEQRTRTFCASEVRAFSLAPRPYIVDFPFFDPLVFDDDDLALLLTSIQWRVVNITSPIQADRGVEVLTLFPTDTLLDQLAARLGAALVDVIDLAKVRVFTYPSGPSTAVRIVPIVTLEPLRLEDARRLATELAGALLAPRGLDPEPLLNHVITPQGQQRLVQWLLSACLGHGLFREFPTRRDLATLDVREAERHFGHQAIESLLAAAEQSKLLWSGEGQPLVSIDPLADVSLPESARSFASATLGEVEPAAGASRSYPDSLLTDFAKVFVDMYHDVEVPARARARELGPGVVDPEPADRQLLDRLENGLAWSSLVSFFCDCYGDRPTPDLRNAYSLVLDICNDLGIAVPVTSEQEGVIFRAWRHGEDVLFSEQELGLVREAVKGLLKGTARDRIPKLHLEKLLVVLIHVGIARNFLQPVHWQGVSRPQARIAFDLKGAVPKIVTSPASSATREKWMSSHLLERGVLRKGDGGPYRLGASSGDDSYLVGEDVDAAYVSSSAPADAQILGYHLGSLLRISDGIRDDAPLGDRELIVLSTCWPPRNVAAAIQAEIDIIREWIDLHSAEYLSLDLDGATPSGEFRKSWRESKGREALFSARMKYVAHRTEEHKQILQQCADYLERNADRIGAMASTIWESYWNAIGEGVPVQESRQVSDRLQPTMHLVYRLTAALSVCEVALEAARARGTKRRSDFNGACLRAREAAEEMREMGYRIPEAERLFERIEELSAQGPDEVQAAAAWTYGQNQIRKLRGECNGLIDELEPLVSEFGQLANRHQFEYIVWYDIVDSMANSRAERGENVEQFRRQTLPGFRAMVNRRLLDLTRAAAEQDCRVHCWEGSVDSSDDQKHVFLAGSNAAKWAGQVVAELNRCLEAYPDIHLRALVAPCNFAGGTAFQIGNDPSVSGAAFSEPLNRLEKVLTDRSRALCESSSHLSLVGSLALDSLELPERVVFRPNGDTEPARIEASGTELEVKLCGGPFGPSEASSR